MTARGKTTPSSTSGSFKPATGARSRVTPDNGTSEPFTKGATVTLRGGQWEGMTGTITRVKAGGLYHVRVPHIVGSVEFAHHELAAADATSATGPNELSADEQRAADWFAGVEGSAVDTLAAGGMIPVARDGTVDGEAVIRYRIGDQLVDVCIEDYGDSSCPRVVPYDPDTNVSISTRSDKNGTDLDTWLATNNMPGDHEEMVGAATDLSWAVGHAERAIGNAALRETRGF